MAQKGSGLEPSLQIPTSLQRPYLG